MVYHAWSSINRLNVLVVVKTLYQNIKTHFSLLNIYIYIYSFDNIYGTVVDKMWLYRIQKRITSILYTGERKILRLNFPSDSAKRIISLLVATNTTESHRKPLLVIMHPITLLRRPYNFHGSKKTINNIKDGDERKIRSIT